MVPGGRHRVVLLSSLLVAIAAASVILIQKNRVLGFTEAKPLITKPQLAEALTPFRNFDGFPNEVDLQVGEKREKVILQYSFDPELQHVMTQTVEKYQPDYGAFVAIDARTGRILSMVSFSNQGDVDDNLVLRASFPSASTFKVVTAAAAITENKFTADSLISFNGSKHTLYKGNVLHFKANRWTRQITLRQAFAESVNSVFAKLGEHVGAPQLKAYAERFGFNRKIASDMPIDTGHANIQGDDWNLAEVASGFTKETRMSPLQGALIASTVVNDGVMMEPFVIQSVHKSDGTMIYQATPASMGSVIAPNTAKELRELGMQTVRGGTGRKSFRGFFRESEFEDVEVGGKTGSLTGDDPKGKYDWFVGWANGPKGRIAVAALTIHKKYWKVKSSYLARVAFEKFFSNEKVPAAERAVSSRSGRKRRRH